MSLQFASFSFQCCCSTVAVALRFSWLVDLLASDYFEVFDGSVTLKNTGVDGIVTREGHDVSSLVVDVRAVSSVQLVRYCC